MFDYFFQKVGGVWATWDDLLDRNASIPAGAKVSELIIPTVDTARQSYFLDSLTRHGVPLLLVGPTGTGKSAITNSYLVRLPRERSAPSQRKTAIQCVCVSVCSYLPNVVNFSARTTANQTQDIIMSKLDRRRKGVFGPPMGKK